MGLTIHYSMQSTSKSVKEIKSILNLLRQKALDLPFHSVREIIDLKGDACDIEKNRKLEDEGLRWALCCVSTSIELSRQKTGNTTYTSFLPVPPKRIIGFIIKVGDGSEPVNIFFVNYPKTIRKGTKIYNVNKPAWSASGFCKTQYANDPKRGGLRHFLRCHTSVIALLEYAQSLPNLKVEINDEGKYGTSNYTDDWTVENPVYYLHPAQHDIEKLAKEIGEWDAMIAAGVGAFKDLLVKNGESPESIVSAIDDRQDREHLEAKGVEANPHIRTNLGL